MSNNNVKDWGEFQKLAELPSLEDLLFVGEPVFTACTSVLHCLTLYKSCVWTGYSALHYAYCHVLPFYLIRCPTEEEVYNCSRALSIPEQCLILALSPGSSLPCNNFVYDL